MVENPHLKEIIGLYNYIHTYCYNRVRDVDVANDLTQDTFVRAIRHLPTYKENGTPIRAWLTTIAKNLVYDYHAKRNLRVAHIDLKEAKKIGITDVQTALSDRLMALKELPNETQKIFILLYVFEYSYEEVGKLTNKSVPAIKGLVFKAKEYFLKKNIPLTDL